MIKMTIFPGYCQSITKKFNQLSNLLVAKLHNCYVEKTTNESFTELIESVGEINAVETENRLYTNEIMNSMGSGINLFSKGNSPSDIVADINAAMKAMTQEERNAKKNSLTAASLPATPSEIKKIADIDTLNKILDIVKS